MWIILGFIAIAATLINIYLFSAGKDYKLAMAAGLSFTALTLCAEISFVAGQVAREDWSAVREVVNFQWALWVLTIISIILNVLPVFLERKDQKKRMNATSSNRVAN
ncbi:hypothetical protein [Jeotgalibacillus haloalkalitolerans]|uniref:MFS transporter n=1 Tax=Jeotgalibacillus haloalkalitolerans TaxID=3104292 RepID=A0ABU5KN96_9BACL|nr:hypothetical protein [Jeotgalibacillus sp. HH7-29]MDZ5712619.1 hypothetical protein [Jeotgalibacillus sp. HH7-29]